MVRMTIEEGKLVCRFLGPLDTTTCQAIEAEVLAKVREAQAPVVLDLKGVEYVASAFLRLCLIVSKQVGLERFSVVNVHPFVKKVLMIANLSEFLGAD
jgi:anti-anti-sigma factor